MAGTIIVDRIESDASYASSINVAAQVTFSNTSTFNAGSVSRPGIAFSGNTSTGMYMPLANTVAWTTAGAETMRLTAAGNLGIGTSSPGANLEVKGSSGQNIYVSYTSGSQLRLKSDSGNSGVGTTGSTPLLFLMNNGEVGQFDTSSNFKFNSGYGSVATAYGCRAWCYYNATPAIVASGNVSSLTVLATGDVRLNFTTYMVDANYAVSATTNEESGGPKWCNATQSAVDNIRVVTFNPSQTKVANGYNWVAVFR